MVSVRSLRSARRELHYRAFRLIAFLRTGPGNVLSATIEPFALHLWAAQVSHGIRICDPFPETRSQFASVIVSCLDLIEKTDHRRMARVRSEVKNIVNMPVYTSAAYSRFHRTCRIDMRCFPVNTDKETSVV